MIKPRYNFIIRLLMTQLSICSSIHVRAVTQSEASEYFGLLSFFAGNCSNFYEHESQLNICLGAFGSGMYSGYKIRWNSKFFLKLYSSHRGLSLFFFLVISIPLSDTLPPSFQGYLALFNQSQVSISSSFAP